MWVDGMCERIHETLKYVIPVYLIQSFQEVGVPLREDFMRFLPGLVFKRKA